MKNRHLFSVRILAVLSLAFIAGCGDDYLGNGGNDIATNKEMILRTDTTSVAIYMAGTGTATINWGDGSSEIVTLSVSINDAFTSQQRYAHNYAVSSSHTITIFGTNITHLDCHDKQLTSLSVSKNTALTYLRCEKNQLTSLDVSKNTALSILRCYSNQLTKLDVSKNTALTILSCEGNQLTSLDVNKNTALTVLWCDGNQLTKLDVNKNTALTWLGCDSNQLTKLDLSKNTTLDTFSFGHNQLTSLALNALFETLHSNAGVIKRISIIGNPGTDTCNRSVATNKGWVFVS